MKRPFRIRTLFLYGVFGLYILFLLKILLFSRISIGELMRGHRDAERLVNLIPFRSIMAYLDGANPNLQRTAFSNVVGNMILFLPLGVYVALFKRDKRVLACMAIVFLVSLSAEIIQGVLCIGTADIYDFILNCAGGLGGILLYKLLLGIFRNEEKARTVYTVVSSIIGMPALLFLLFVVQLRL